MAKWRDMATDLVNDRLFISISSRISIELFALQDVIDNNGNYEEGMSALESASSCLELLKAMMKVKRDVPRLEATSTIPPNLRAL
jgi:hypothetical protein